jgi:hypothetical protein
MAETACFAVKQRSRSWHRYGLLVVHVFAGATGGLVIGLVLGALGALLSPSARLLLALVAIVAAAWDLRRGRMAKLQPPHGVPEAWRAWSPIAYFSAYGFILGGGLFTPYTASAMYALTGLVLAHGDPQLGALAFGSYGAVRALISMVAGVAGLTFGITRVTSVLQELRSTWRLVLAGLALAASVSLLLAR